MYVYMSVSFAFLYIQMNECREKQRRQTHMEGVLLSAEGSAVSRVKLFGCAILEKAASNIGSYAIRPFRTGTF